MHSSTFHTEQPEMIAMRFLTPSIGLNQLIGRSQNFRTMVLVISVLTASELMAFQSSDFPPLDDLPRLSDQPPDPAVRSPVSGGTGLQERPADRTRRGSESPLPADPFRRPAGNSETEPPGATRSRGGLSEEFGIDIGPAAPLDRSRDWLSLPDESFPVTDGAFDWTLQPISAADVGVGRDWPFEHGKANFTDAERDAYVDIVRAVMDRKTMIPADIPENMNARSFWESAFYRYKEVRRQSWENGRLRLDRRSVDHVDPFSSRGSRVISTLNSPFESSELKQYSLTIDMQSHPRDFVARPVVMYGIFTPLESVELLARRTLEGEERVFRMQRGILKNLSGTQTIAMLDAMSFVDTESQTVPSSAWPVEKRVSIPVLVKGWFVKLWLQQPLIYTDVVRVLTPRPYDEYIREQVSSRRRITDDESWLFHETLRQLQVTSSDVQYGIAAAEQTRRIQSLQAEMRRKAKTETDRLNQDFRNGTLPREDTGNREGYETRKRRIERQLAMRESRYAAYQKKPETFPTYVDVFQNPDHWQGRLITLRGHVRRVTQYSGDNAFFDGHPLYELWMFTGDSQQNPAVIITPSLPPDFPKSAELIDSVTVTGCFFKMYVYRSQKENRLAPLLLAGHVSWNPAADHVLNLAKAGHLPENSPLVRTAKSRSRPVSDTVILFLGFLSLLAVMTVWGRVQRDRRERQRLKKLVDERPDFRHTTGDPERLTHSGQASFPV